MKLILIIVLFFSAFLKAQDNSLEVDKAFSSLVEEENMEPLSLLFSSGAVTPQTKDKHGNTLLHKAVLLENLLAVRVLLDYGADPYITDADGDTVFDLLQWIENEKITAIFDKIKKTSADKKSIPSTEDVREEIILLDQLWQAVNAKNFSAVESLLSVGGEDIQINKMNKDGNTLLTKAVFKFGWLKEQIEIIKKNQGDGDSYEYEEDLKVTVFEKEQVFEIIKILLKYGADPNIGLSNRAVFYVISDNLLELVPLLAKHKADLNFDRHGYLYLWRILEDEKIFLASVFLENGADINAQHSSNKQTVLHELVKEDKLKMVLFALKNGADPAIQDKNKRKPVFYAESKKMIHILVRAEMPAIERGKPALVSRAIKNHPDLRAALNDMFLPYGGSISFYNNVDHLKMIGTLLELGVEPAPETLKKFFETVDKSGSEQIELLKKHRPDLLPCRQSF